MRRSIGFGVYGENPFQPNFVVCKFEGGTANCPKEYVKEFGALDPDMKINLNILGMSLALGAVMAFVALPQFVSPFDRIRNGLRPRMTKEEKLIGGAVASGLMFAVLKTWHMLGSKPAAQTTGTV